MKGKSLKGSAWFAVFMCLMLMLSMAGCRKTDPETTQPETTEQTPTTTENDPAPITTEEDEEPEIIQAGTMSADSRGKNGDEGVYFRMEPNDVPADSSWATEFRPTTADAIQLIRDGETYNIGKSAAGMVIKFSDTEYYLKLEQWIIRDYYPITDGDILKINGVFRNGAANVFFQIDTTYIQYTQGLVLFSTEYPEGSGVNVRYVGNMTADSRGANGSEGIYFQMEKNSLPYKTDWSLEYKPADKSAVQLIRNGKTYSIANTAAGMIVKFSETEYYLKLEKWIIKDYYPIQDGDILVVGGKFTNSENAVVASFAKTYISLKDGLLKFSTDYPTGEDAIKPVLLTGFASHPNGYTGTGLYFYADENDIVANSDWSTEYRPKDSTCVRLIRDGKTYEIGNTAAGALIKFSDTEWYLKLEQWIYKDNFPFRDGDILHLSGKFVNSGTAEICEIKDLYISIADGMAFLSETYPEETVEIPKIQAGTMSAHSMGWTGESGDNAGGLYFTMAENGAPYVTDWSTRYQPQSNGCVKLIRDGKTYEVGNTGAGMIVKYSDTEYYLEFWPMGDCRPIREDDILVVEGSFVDNTNGVVLVVDKTYISLKKGIAKFSTEYPTEEEKQTVIQAGTMSAHANSWASSAESNGGLYFTMAENEFPYVNDWSTRLNPLQSSCIKLIRDGETHEAGNTGTGMIVKYSDTEYYMEFWPMGAYKPLLVDDILVVEGDFVDPVSGVILSIDRTYVKLLNGMAKFSAEYPTDDEEPEKELNAGNVIAAENTALNGGVGFYFDMSNGSVIPTNGDDNWDNRFMPTTADTVKLIRDGATTSIGNPAAGEFVKYSETGYYMDLAAWSHPGVTPFVSGDILVIEGYYTNGTVVFKVEKSIITIGEDGNLSFTTDSTGLPDEKDVQAGHMSCATMTWNANDSGWFNNNTALYFALTPNDVPASPDWDVEYSPERVSNLQLTRDGETYNIGNLGRGTVIKVEEAIYVLKLETWTIGGYAPLQVGDVLTVEGRFVGVTNANGETSDYKLNISKTQITIGEDYVLSYTNMEDSTPSVIEAGKMTAHADGWNMLTNKSFSFTLPENTAPADASGTIAYTPTSENAVTLIRDGVSYAIANPAREILAKLGDTHYQLRLESWTIGDYAPIVPGDILVVDGSFYYAVTDTTIHIEKTVVIVGDGYALTYADDVPNLSKTMQLTGLQAEELSYNASDNTYLFRFAGTALGNSDTLVLVPTEVDNIQIVRDGNAVGIAAVGQDTLAVWGGGASGYIKVCQYYANLAGTGVADVSPKQGDVFIICGQFQSGDTTVAVEKTFIQVGADNALTFSTEDPADADVIKAGAMGAHTTGLSGNILYFTMAENDLVSNRTKTDFRPFTASVISIIRDGKTYKVADTTQKTMEKYTAQNYKLHTDALTMELQDGDVLVISGKFTGGRTDQDETYTFSVTTTYITIVSVADGKVTFSTTAP